MCSLTSLDKHVFFGLKDQFLSKGAIVYKQLLPIISHGVCWDGLYQQTTCEMFSFPSTVKWLKRNLVHIRYTIHSCALKRFFLFNGTCKETLMFMWLAMY